jgi:peptide/nickel transport system substrate-binding protein
MRAKRLRIAVTAVAVAALTAGASGCAKSGRDNGGSGKTGGTLVFAGAGDPRNFDPILNDDGESLRVIRQVYDTLIQNKPGTAELQPALAEKWDHDPTGTEWTFSLRKGVKFTDGTDFNAAAVCFNFDRWYNMKGDAAQSLMAYYADVFEGFAKNDAQDLGKSLYSGCTAKDTNTAVIKINKYKGAFPGAFTLASFSIASPTALKQYNADTVTKQGDSFAFSEFATAHPVGTGAFSFGGWDKSTGQITLNRNDNYWGGKPNVDKVVIRIIKDANTRKQELKAGTVDVIDYPGVADQKELSGAGFNVIARPAFNILYLGLNQKSNAKLADLRVRQAVAYAINRDQLAKTIGPAGTEVAKEFMPKTVTGYAEDVQQYNYDPAKAKQLLTEAGAGDLSLNFYYPPDVSRPYMLNPTDIFNAISKDLQAVGIKVTGTPRPWNGGYKTDIQVDGKPDAHIIGWTGDYNDPGNFVATFFGRGKPDFGDQGMTDMFAAIAAANSEVDEARKAQLWKQVNRDVMAKWLPAIPIWHAPPAIVTSKKVSNLVASPLTDERFNTVRKSA